ncbi:MAG: DUF262 domain-containing protein [Lachnospiraceae bacterium]|nr:DUF262 domain-containing protein [Lachnospiraceae bacterium]
MLTPEIRDDLDKIVAAGLRQGGVINDITVFNFYAGLRAKEKTEEIHSAIFSYLEENGVLVVNDGVEIEGGENGESISEIRPFDPSKIDIEMKTMELSSIIKRIYHKEVNLNTDFQRKAGLWSDQKKSQLIESILLRIPLPAFYFDGGDSDNWLIIDGLQRITALKEFVVDQTLVLSGLEFFKDLEGLGFSELPRTFTRRIEETNIIAYIVKSGTPSNVKYNIFKRINTGGLELTPQEIRHALYQGKATNICKMLAEKAEFKEATTYSLRSDRMQDREFVLRFVAVCYYGIDKYDGIPDNYLNGAMDFLNQKDSVDEKELEKAFGRVMVFAEQIMGRYAFRKLGVDGMRRPINKAIYEAWCRSLHILSDEDAKILIDKKEKVYKKFMDLCDSYSFLGELKASDKKSFGARFMRVQQMMEGIINDYKDECKEF